MTHKLDQILISSSQPDFMNRLIKVYLSKAGMSHFGLGPKHVENRQEVEQMDIIVSVQ